MRIVVLMPNWLGDAVMATPFLRGLRKLYPAAHIAAAARPLVAPALAGLSSVNETMVFEKGEDARTVRWLKGERFDLGISLPNSFRSAWVLWRGRVKRRIGYGRGGRSWLFTKRARAVLRSASQRESDHRKAAAIEQLGGGRTQIGSAFEPMPTVDYYLALLDLLENGTAASAVGRPLARKMELAITDAERGEADMAIAEIDNGKSKVENLIIIVPGANFGASKCWAPERFAALAERLADRAGAFRADVLLAGSPAEMPIMDAILAALSTQRDRIHALPKLNGGKGVSLEALKELVRRSRLMICNDTGPRHFAAALGTPVVTLFGPTDPRWAETFFEKERIIRADPFPPCGPCQLKKCPIDHRCMNDISVDAVLAAALALWTRETSKSAPLLTTDH